MYGMVCFIDGENLNNRTLASSILYIYITMINSISLREQQSCVASLVHLVHVNMNKI